MKKYNKSEIMKNAWNLKKACELTFAECLKKSWEMAKRTVKKVVEKHIQILNVAKWILRKMDSDTFMALDSGICVNDIVLERETEKAIQISTEWDGYKKLIWLPKSAVSYR